MKSFRITFLAFGCLAASIACCQVGGGGIGSEDPRDPNDPLNYRITYESDGEDITVNWGYGIGGNAEATVGHFPWNGNLATIGATNSTHYSLSPIMTSRGWVKVKVEWIGDPAYCPPVAYFRVTAPTVRGSESHPKGDGELNNGLGSRIEEDSFGFYQIEPKIRGITLGGAPGELRFDKFAKCYVTAPYSIASAGARGVHAALDNRYVSILYGGGPMSMRLLTPTTGAFTLSDGRAMTYTWTPAQGYVPELTYDSQRSNYASWDIGYTAAYHKQIIALGSSYYEPPLPEDPRRRFMFTGSISYGPRGPHPVNYAWSGNWVDELESQSGSLPDNGSWEIPPHSEFYLPEVHTDTIDRTLAEEKITHSSFVERDPLTYTLKLNATFDDGVSSESVRDIHYHPVREVGGPLLLSSGVTEVTDPNVNGAWKSADFDMPANTDPYGQPGWATKGSSQWGAKVYPEDKTLNMGLDLLNLVASEILGLAPGGKLVKVGVKVLGNTVEDAINSYRSVATHDLFPRDLYKLPQTIRVDKLPAQWWRYFALKSEPRFEDYIQHFHWKFKYRPVITRAFFEQDGWGPGGFTGRTVIERRDESDMRNSNYWFTFQYFKTFGGPRE